MNIAGFPFHGLQGNPKRWSVWVTANYRVTFGWSGEEAMAIDRSGEAGRGSRLKGRKRRSI